MTVAELIANELGVKIGEKFIFDNNTYRIESLCFIDGTDNTSYAFNSSKVQYILTHKDKIVKINSLADSWDIESNEPTYFISYTGRVGDGSACKSMIDSCNANKNKYYMQLIADKQNLFRKMLKFADCNNVKTSDSFMYYIYFDIGTSWRVGDVTLMYEPFVVYFASKKIAREALELFGNELEEIRLAEIKIRG